MTNLEIFVYFLTVACNRFSSTGKNENNKKSDLKKIENMYITDIVGCLVHKARSSSVTTFYVFCQFLSYTPMLGHFLFPFRFCVI